jgi:hypothetical protein
MRTNRIVLALAAFSLAACGIQLPEFGFGPEPGGRLTCGGGPSFPAAILEGGGAAEDGADPAAAALRTYLGTNHMDIDFLPDTGWIEVSRTDGAVLYLAPDPAAEGSWAYASVGQDGGAWEVDGWGGCPLQPDVGAGLGIASFRVAPDAELDPAATEIAVLVTEWACNSGEDAQGRIVVSAIDEDDDSVTMTFAVRPRGGGQECPGNPETPFVLELSEPLGDRSVLDGSSVPPRDATVCPDIASCP